MRRHLPLLLFLSAVVAHADTRLAASTRRKTADRFGARIEHTIRICLDDPATPAAGAHAVWSSSGPGNNEFRIHSFESVAGTDGVLRLEGISLPYARLAVEMPGAYPAETGFRLDLPAASDAWHAEPAAGPWLPDGALRLRSVRRPHPMARSSLSAKLPEDETGYDAEKGAFLPPLGDGETADFFVRGGQIACRTSHDFAWMIVRPAPDGGALRVEPDRHDALRLPREAPAEGWSEEPLRFYAADRGPSAALPPALWSLAATVGRRHLPLVATCGHRLMPGAERGEPPENPILFRSRVRRGPGGEIKAARYGAILPSASSPFGQAFEVFFNPVDNERSLEPEDWP